MIHRNGNSTYWSQPEIIENNRFTQYYMVLMPNFEGVSFWFSFWSLCKRMNSVCMYTRWKFQKLNSVVCRTGILPAMKRLTVISTLHLKISAESNLHESCRRWSTGYNGMRAHREPFPWLKHFIKNYPFEFNSKTGLVMMSKGIDTCNSHRCVRGTPHPLTQAPQFPLQNAVYIKHLSYKKQDI